MKQRFQNPVINDEIRLQLFAYNSNNRANVDSIEKIEIYFLDNTERTSENPDGRRLVETIDGGDVELEEAGLYSATITAENQKYTIGNYIDIWYVTVHEQEATIPNNFQIYPDLWFTTTTPIIYGFDFSFRPNRVRQGEKRYLVVEIVPNVPSHSELIQYYENLAITSPIKISIEQQCGPCVPQESDLRLIADREDVELREKCQAYYFIDTSEMELGIYDVWFEIELGESTFISERQQLQIA